MAVRRYEARNMIREVISSTRPINDANEYTLMIGSDFDI